MSASSTEGMSLRKQVATILGVLSTSIYGISLMENPVGFVAAAVMKLVIGWFMGTVGFVTGLIGDLWDILVDALTGAGAAALSPFGIAGGIILDLIALVQELSVGLAMGVGPLAPVIAVVLWALVFAALGLLARIALEIYRWIPGT